MLTYVYYTYYTWHGTTKLPSWEVIAQTSFEKAGLVLPSQLPPNDHTLVAVQTALSILLGTGFQNATKLKLFIEGSLEVKLPTIWTDEKQRWEESEKRREEKKKEKVSEERRSKYAKR